jgi:hypothetical protein
MNRLAQSLGVPGEYRDPSVHTAIDKVLQLSKERGIAIAKVLHRPDNGIDNRERAYFPPYGTNSILMRREAERASHALASGRRTRISERPSRHL